MESGEEALFYGDLKVPEALAPILKDVTKEILRKGLTSKEEIILFMENYFKNKSTENQN